MATTIEDPAVTREHYQHMQTEVRQLLSQSEATPTPCPCERCTRPAGAALIVSLHVMASRLQRAGCSVSVPEKVTQSQGEHVLAAMTRTLHAMQTARGGDTWSRN